jgi:hypothetical protein
MKRTAFVYGGVEHWTMPDLVETIQLVGESEAADFMEAYAAVCGEETATHNLRYMLDILSRKDRETALALADVFMVELPGEHEVLAPRHTFGMSSYGVVLDKPLPDYRERSHRKPSAPTLYMGAPESAPVTRKPTQERTGRHATASNNKPSKATKRVEFDAEQARGFLDN